MTARPIEIRATDVQTVRFGLGNTIEAGHDLVRGSLGTACRVFTRTTESGSGSILSSEHRVETERAKTVDNLPTVWR